MLENKNIYTYTRQDAINDGILIPIEDTLRDKSIARIYKFPICLTTYAWEKIRNATEETNLDGIMYDMLWMSTHPIKRLDDSTSLFTFAIDAEKITLKIMCHPGDDFAPVLTIMGKYED